jgi:hypothetical protein
VQRIADNLRHRAVMGEHNVSHAREVFIEQRSEDAGFQRLRKRGETVMSVKRVAISRRCPTRSMPMAT